MIRLLCFRFSAIPVIQKYHYFLHLHNFRGLSYDREFLLFAFFLYNFTRPFLLFAMVQRYKLLQANRLCCWVICLQQFVNDNKKQVSK